MKDGDTIIHNGITYMYDSYYDRFTSFTSGTKFEVLCPKCLSGMFSISYGTNECIANCVCGHSFTIYNG